MSNSENIVSFKSAAKKAAPKSHRMAQVEGYWEGLRRGRLVPDRADILASGIADSLSHVMLLDQISPTLARLRVSGLYYNQLMGMEVRGMPLSALFVPAAREELGQSLHAVFEEPTTLRLTLISDPGLGRARMEATLLILPLRDENGAITKAIGILDCEDKIGREPRRFRITNSEIKGLTGYGHEQTPYKQASGFAEPKALFRPKPSPKAEKPYLRLVPSDDT